MLNRKTMDANEAVARIAYACSDLIAIYPITPASPMGEHADAWMVQRAKNIFGRVPEVIQLQSEAGAAGTVHGGLQAGATATTFTASQGLLLMIPNMYKIAGELSPAVFHVAARTIATHALSIFGDHSDVMACRATGWAMLCSSSVQEAADLALVAHRATLQSRIPFLHFFDGFRTSHELNGIFECSYESIRMMIDSEAMAAHRKRGLTPDEPKLRGSAQNPDVFFQAREAVNRFYDQTPDLVQAAMDRLAELSGRSYHPFDYEGDPDADRVIVMMGSGVGAAEEAIEDLRRTGEKVGIVKVRLYRPWDAGRFLKSLPNSVQRIAVLDRTKEPGAPGEPLYLDVVSSLDQARRRGIRCSPGDVEVIGGRYGLASKEFTPGMVRAIFKELRRPEPMNGFTIGIVDDVTHRSLPWDESDGQIKLRSSSDIDAVFYGLGSDGTVGATKNTVKIIGDHTELFAQGYFVYDSKKSGAMTVSHVRISAAPIRSTYLVQKADLVACHQFSFLDRIDVLERAVQGATFLLNAPFGPESTWDHLPRQIQRVCFERQLKLFVVDAEAVARAVQMPGRINVVMQVCFFALTQAIPKEEAIEHIKLAIEETYGKRGRSIVERNLEAVDRALASLRPVVIPTQWTLPHEPDQSRQNDSQSFVERVTKAMLAGLGDRLPVSAMPVDGTFPTGTSKLEKRSIAAEVPLWKPELCIQCGLCALVCPHAAIRTKAFEADRLADAPEGFSALPWSSKNGPNRMMSIQVAVDDCTGCGVCVDICPARSKQAIKVKALNMTSKVPIQEKMRKDYSYFLSLPEMDRTSIDQETVKGSQFLLPLFEYSGACAGCGETPYLKLLSQLFGDRLVIANATGCSSIYGGNLPTTPWTSNEAGRGPAWVNSLFEDNAEFGLGMRLGLDQKRQDARDRLKGLAALLPTELVDALLRASQESELEIADQRLRVEQLRALLSLIESIEAKELIDLADSLVRKSVWIVGGDGWAYDIGFGGLDHVLASGKNVNVLVLDTEVYSNTGGQASKSTPRAAVAKFAAAGKAVGKKDIGMIAMAYGHVYVAQIALGAHPLQAIKAFHEAEAYEGPSLLLAYSQCIAHGIDLSTGMTHQKDAVHSGYWPLYRYDPRVGHDGGKPFHLDSRKPTVPFREFATKEARFSMLMRSDPSRAEKLLDLAQKDIHDRWHYYEQIANVERSLAGFLEDANR